MNEIPQQWSPVNIRDNLLNTVEIVHSAISGFAIDKRSQIEGEISTLHGDAVAESVTDDRPAGAILAIAATLEQSGDTEQAMLLFFAAHEILRLRSFGRPPSEPRRRGFEGAVRCLVRRALKPHAGRDVYGEDALEAAMAFYSQFSEFVDPSIQMWVGGLLIEELDRIRVEHARDEDFISALILRNLRLVLTSPAPAKAGAVKRVWRSLGRQIAPYVMIEVSEIEPQPEDNLEDLIPLPRREALSTAIEKADEKALRTELEALEPLLAANLKAKLAGRFGFQQPVSTMFGRDRAIDPYFSQAKRMLEAGDKTAIEKFEELQRRTRSSIATEWLAYSITVLDSKRTNNVIKLLEDCLNHEYFNENHQWVARWNLAFALRRQGLRKGEALDVLLPTLEETLIREPTVLDMCVSMALEDVRHDVLPSLLKLCRHFEAQLLYALGELRLGIPAKQVAAHFGRLEMVFHDSTALPHPEEQMSPSQLDDITERFVSLSMLEAGAEWFMGRLYERQNRQFFKNYQCLGRLQEQLGDLDRAWLSYAKEVELSLKSTRIPDSVKARSLNRLLQFAQSVEGLRGEADRFLTRFGSQASLPANEMRRWHELLRAENKHEAENRQPAPVQGKAALSLADAQAVIDATAPLFATINRPYELLSHLNEARELCDAISTKSPTSSTSEFVEFLGVIANLNGGQSEENARIIVDDLRSRSVRLKAAGEASRDLFEISSCCLRVLRDVELQLNQEISVTTKMPSRFKAQFVTTSDDDPYATKVFVGIDNNFEYAVPVTWLHVSTRAKNVALPLEGVAFSRHIPPKGSVILECDVKINGELEPEIDLSVHVRFDVGGVTRAKRDTDRIKVVAALPRIPVEERYTLGPIPPGRDDLFHGRREAMDDLLSGLSGGRLKALYFVNGIRRVGKTTLLRQVGGQIGQNTLVITLDLQVVAELFGSVSEISTISFVRRLTISVLEFMMVEGLPTTVRELSEADFGQEAPWYIFDRWLDTLIKESGRDRILLCIDEMQSIVKLVAREVLDDSFLTWIRNKVERPSRVLLICTASEPYSRMRMRYEHNLWGSVKTFRISFLRKADMFKVAETPVLADGVVWSGLSLESLWDMTEGHPWITQGICDRVMRDLNRERRRVVLPQDIDRATENLILDDPTAVRLWWNESQDLVTPDMLRVVTILLTSQNVSRSGVPEAELIRGCALSGIRGPGSLVPEMIDLELLTRTVGGSLTIRSRFLENFLENMRSRDQQEKEAIRARGPGELVGLAIDWENAKYTLDAIMKKLDPARVRRLRGALSGARLGEKLVTRANMLGYSTPDTRIAVAAFEENAFFKGDRAALDNLNIQTQNSNTTGNVKADRSDHRLVQRIRDVLERSPLVRCFVIVAGDADFYETVVTLLDRGKRVCVICTRSGISEEYERLKFSQDKLEIDYLEDFALAE